MPSEFTWRDAIAHGLIALGAMAMLLTARLLTPAPAELGTHEQLGLPPCPFFHFTGFPCPTCGITTCFTHATRAHFYNAFHAQPFGLLVFVLTVAAIPLSLVLLARRARWSELISVRQSRIAGYGLLILCLLGWLYKIVVMKLAG